MTTTVGVIVNPLAGKDIRRLVANASPVSDAAKMGMVRRAVAGAAEAEIDRIMIAGDHHALGRRAIDGLDVGACTEITILDDHVTGDRSDTTAAAVLFAKAEAGAVVVFGGDGTHRDVAAGWADAPLVAVSTGTNNVYPIAWEATSAGTAAGLVASGAVPLGEVATPSKLITARIVHPDRVVVDVALVEVALVDGAFIGSRAVWEPSRIRVVLAAIATPASTGLASIAGRALPVDRGEPRGALVELGEGGRSIRLPLSPGSFVTVDVAASRPVEFTETVVFHGPGVLALDGERSHVLGPDTIVEITIDQHGPAMIDVTETLVIAANAHRFDVVQPATPPSGEPDVPSQEDPHVD